MAKNKHIDRIIVRAKMNFPFECYVGVAGLLFTLLICLKQIIINGKNEIEWYGVLCFCFLCFIFMILLSGHQYKKLIVYSDHLEIRRLFNPIKNSFKFEELKGFELCETFGRSELQLWIKIIKANDKKIAFVRDNYSNYDKMIHGLHQTGLSYFGTKQMKWKYKNRYAIILKWSAILFPFVYVLFLLEEASRR